MNSEGFKGIPGVPEGYELLRIDYPVKGDVYARNGEVCEWVAVYPSREAFPIIRKIETPKRFRPFANGAEYMVQRKAVTVDWNCENDRTGFYAVVSASDHFVWVAFGKGVEQLKWDQAFEKLVFRDIDGSTSPFGVEVKDE